jgi:hypothetical protein
MRLKLVEELYKLAFSQAQALLTLSVCESCVSKFSNQREKNKLAVKLPGQGKGHRKIISKGVNDEPEVFTGGIS